jgi:hypothetical protein
MKVQPGNLVSRGLVQSSRVRLLADFGAELHAPIALDDGAQLSAAMVAADCHEPRVHALGDGARYPIAATEVL